MVGIMLAAASEAGREADLRLHAFEPDSRAFARLAEALDGKPAASARRHSATGKGPRCST